MKKREPIRVLQCVNKMDRAGLETMLMNYYRNIDRDKVQFDFLTHRDEDGAYDNEIKKMGGKVYHAPRLMPQNYKRYSLYMKKIFEEHPEYKIVHSHIDTMTYFPLKEAKKNNIPYRISHSHSSKLDKDIKFPIKFYGKIKTKDVANIYFSCGQKAGEFLYGKNEKFKIINNAIDLDKFRYDSKKRNELRKKYNIDVDTMVIGHVGRYIYIKNQMFLISILHELLKLRQKAKLMLVGTGKDESKLRGFAKKMNIDDNVLFFIDRNDVNDLYQMMDVFVMPSLFEGLPLVGVEAQANGLPSIFSDKISKEVLMTNNCKMLKLEQGVSAWTKIIIEINKERNKDSIEQIKDRCFDIKEESKKLQEFYINLNKK